MERGHQAQCCVDAADATGFLYFPVFLIPTKKKKRDTAFFRALNEIRVGKVSDESLALLNSRVGQNVGEQVAGDGQSGIFATRLRARRAGVAESNAALLAALPRGGGVLFRSQDEGPSSLLDSLAAPSELRLKPGAQVCCFELGTPLFDCDLFSFRASFLQVMLTTSLHFGELRNGARGVVEGFDSARSHCPIVRFCGLGGRKGRCSVALKFSFWKKRWNSMHRGSDVVRRGGERTTRGVATSASTRSRLDSHSAQESGDEKDLLFLPFAQILGKGMSLDFVEVDVSDVFAMGQTYVALSRCTSLEGLFLEKKVFFLLLFEQVFL